MPSSSNPIPHIPAKTNRVGLALHQRYNIPLDRFAWLQEATSDELTSLQTAENTFLERTMRSSGWSALRETIHRELLDTVIPAEETIPEQFGQHFYFVSSAAGQSFPVYRRKLALDSPDDEVLLDLNQMLNAWVPFIGLGLIKISPDETKMLYSLDTVGSEDYQLYLKHIPPGLPHLHRPADDEALPAQVGNFEWSLRGDCLFYAAVDALKRPHRIYRHVLGRPLAEDVLVYEEPDESFAVGVALTRDQRFLIITSSSKQSTEIRFIPADEPTAPPKLVLPRTPGIRYFVDTFQDFFVALVKSESDRSFRIHRVDITGPHATTWPKQLSDFAPLLPPAPPPAAAGPAPEVVFEDVEVFSNALVSYERYQGRQRVRIHQWDGQKGFQSRVLHCAELHDQPLHYAPALNHYTSTHYRVSISTPIVEPRTYEVPLSCVALAPDAPLETLPLPDRFSRAQPLLSPSEYSCTQSFVQNPHDNTAIPVTLVHPARLQRNHANPLLLLAYGAYGASFDAEFNPLYLPFLKRGWVVAFAHVRGGGEFGPLWHDQGRLMHKHNTFDDYVAVLENLITQGYTRPELVAAMGASAGGLTLAASINKRPALFAAAVMNVPFVDVLSPMLQPELPLTVAEYLEWGDPNQEDVRAYIAAYDPYLNIPSNPQSYPRILLTASTLDLRVPVWIPFKYAAKLRQELPSPFNQRVFLKVDDQLGHAGEGGRYAFDERSLHASFLIDSIQKSSNQL